MKKNMTKFTNLEVGKMGLVQQTEDGTIKQIGLTPEQSEQLHMFLAIISKTSPLVKLNEEYDLKFKN